MANEFYDKDSLANMLLWEENIKAGKQLRKMYPPQILFHKNGHNCRGYYDYCEACGTKIYAEFGDYSTPLAEKFVECSVSDKVGHGIWASAINVTLN